MDDNVKDRRKSEIEKFLRLFEQSLISIDEAKARLVLDEFESYTWGPAPNFSVQAARDGYIRRVK